MRRWLWLVDRICGQRLAIETRRQLAEVTSAHSRSSRSRAQALIRQLAREAGPHVLLGEAEWGEPVRLPLELLAKAHSVITGGTGSGKTMAALRLVQAILLAPRAGISFGVLDAKGELFERTLYLIGQALERLTPPEAERLRERLVIVDLSSPDPVTSYNIAAPWPDSDLDFFAASRVDTLQELLPSGDGLSLRGSAIVKNVLKLLAEHRLPFSQFDRVLSSEGFRGRLLARAADEDVRQYFRFHFPSEGRATVAAVRARIASALLGASSLKLALSGDGAPDLRALQDAAAIVLINCAGPNIARPIARTLQALFLSDIRQAVFARRGRAPYLWVCDEAQNFFRTRQLRDNMADLLTMSRSFGSFFLYLTQNLSTAVQDGEMLETLHTNIRWSLSLRGTPRDAAFLQPALPLTGRVPKPRLNPYVPVEFHSAGEERAMLLNSLAHLPDRLGWLWLKARSPEALKIRTQRVEIPAGDAFVARVASLRGDARLGRRLPRGSYLAEIARRDAEWLEERSDPLAQMKDSYRAQQGVEE